MPHTETMLESQRIYEGKILNLRKDKVLLENGRTSWREVVEHKGAAAVVAVDEKDNLLLVRQYRYALGQELLEIPAGKLDHEGEDPRSAAARELREETGCLAGELEYLGAFYPSVGYGTEVIHLFEAHKLTQAAQQLDEDEFLDVVRLPVAKAVEMALSGLFPDGKTQCAILRLAACREGKQ